MTTDHTTILSEDGTYRAVLSYDEHPMTPRDSDCNVSVLWAEHRRYCLGDRSVAAMVPEFDEVSDFIDEMHNWHMGEDLVHAIVKHIHRTYGATVVLPLFLHDHSGLSMWAGPALSPWKRTESGQPGWDTSYVGFAFDTERTRETTGVPAERMEEAIRQDVETYSSYLEGDVHMVRLERLVEVQTITRRGGSVISDVTGQDWDTVEIVGGFIGSAYAEEEARTMLKGVTS